MGRTALPPRRSHSKPTPGLAGGGLAPGGTPAGAHRRPWSRRSAPAPGPLPRGGAAAGAHLGGGAGGLEPVPATPGPPTPGKPAGRDCPGFGGLEPAGAQWGAAPRYRWGLAGAGAHRRPRRAGSEPACMPQLGRLRRLDGGLGGSGRGRGPALLEATGGAHRGQRRRQPPALGRSQPGGEPLLRPAGLAGGDPALLAAPPKPGLPVFWQLRRARLPGTPAR